MKLRPFELTLVIIFAVMGIAALIILKFYDPPPDDPSTGELSRVGDVTIWGTLPAEGVNSLLSELIEENEAYGSVSYTFHHPDDFDSVLLRALADSEGPDLILVSHEKLVDMRKRIIPTSYESFPEPDIRGLYIDGAQIHALSDGLYGFPIAVDPLMMYWNRDILSTKGFLEAPSSWETLVNTMFPKLIERDFDRTIQRSVVAMGEYENVRNGFGIISALLIQGGSKGVTEQVGIDEVTRYTIQLQMSEGGNSSPIRKAADFYTRFSKPSNTLYSWNRAFQEDRQQFISEDLVFYFGYGSEGPQIERINPNLNFGVAEIPQSETATVRRTYGKFYGLSLLKSSDNIAGASALMFNLSTPTIADQIAMRSNMVPVYRSSVTQGSNDKFGRIVFQSAPITYGWLNPELLAADNIFKEMTQDINENRSSVEGAVGDAVYRLQEEY